MVEKNRYVNFRLNFLLRRGFQRQIPLSPASLASNAILYTTNIASEKTTKNLKLSIQTLTEEFQSVVFESNEFEYRVGFLVL